MYHVYQGVNRITHTPVSYNHLLKYILSSAMIDWNKISKLSMNECYSYEEFKIVRATWSTGMRDG